MAPWGRTMSPFPRTHAPYALGPMSKGNSSAEFKTGRLSGSSRESQDVLKSGGGAQRRGSECRPRGLHLPPPALKGGRATRISGQDRDTSAGEGQILPSTHGEGTAPGRRVQPREPHATPDCRTGEVMDSCGLSEQQQGARAPACPGVEPSASPGPRRGRAEDCRDRTC